MAFSLKKCRPSYITLLRPDRGLVGWACARISEKQWRYRYLYSPATSQTIIIIIIMSRAQGSARTAIVLACDREIIVVVAPRKDTVCVCVYGVNSSRQACCGFLDGTYYYYYEAVATDAAAAAPWVWVRCAVIFTLLSRRDCAHCRQWWQ